MGRNKLTRIPQNAFVAQCDFSRLSFPFWHVLVIMRLDQWRWAYHDDDVLDYSARDGHVLDSYLNGRL